MIDGAAYFLRGWRGVEDHVAHREAISFADRMGENYNFAERIALVHSELSEALEGERRGRLDKHLPERPAGEVELADAVIRIMGIAAVMQWDLPGAILAKAEYNDRRKDHSAAGRSALYGKKF